MVGSLDEAVDNLRNLSRSIRVRCDAVTGKLDAIAMACDAVNARRDDADAIADICADRLQPSSDQIAEDCKKLLNEARLLDLRIADIWDAIDEMA